MLKLIIPEPLLEEFATVDTLWRSTGKTRRVDALMLSWVKYEKQLRRLFCFLLFQHPKIGADKIDEVIAVLAENRRLNPEAFIAGIEALGVTPVPNLLGSNYDKLWSEITRIRTYRNKLIHGQITGQGIKSPQLERDVLWIIEWIACLAAAADSTFGYDGLKRNTYSVARSTSKILVGKYPFTTPVELKAWLSALTVAVRLIRRLSRFRRFSPRFSGRSDPY
jgi:hypothetical protein